AHEFFREKGSHPFCPCDEPNYYYYASDSDIAWLKQADVALPDGFEYVILSPEQADEMVSVMLHADEDDAKMVKLRLAKLPGVGVRFKETGELAAFEYTDGFGFLANLYTVPSSAIEASERSSSDVYRSGLLSNSDSAPRRTSPSTVREWSRCPRRTLCGPPYTTKTARSRSCDGLTSARRSDRTLSFTRT
ncbi:hypothetical protein AAVH_43759, partial [Aphelenchoides avenae]